MFQKGTGNWTQYRGPGVEEVDFHRAENVSERERAYQGQFAYEEHMARVRDDALAALKSAHERGVKRVMFTHGWSTSKSGQTTSRSVIRQLMRSKEATPFIVRRDCIEHQSVFVAAIRPTRAP